MAGYQAWSLSWVLSTAEMLMLRRDKFLMPFWMSLWAMPLLIPGFIVQSWLAILFCLLLAIMVLLGIRRNTRATAGYQCSPFYLAHHSSHVIITQ